MCRTEISPPISPSLAVSLVSDTVRCTPELLCCYYTIRRDSKTKETRRSMNGMSTMHRNGMYAETGCANTAALFRSISLGLAPDAGINGPKMPEEGRGEARSAV